MRSVPGAVATGSLHFTTRYGKDETRSLPLPVLTSSPNRRAKLISSPKESKEPNQETQDSFTISTRSHIIGKSDLGRTACSARLGGQGIRTPRRKKPS